MEEEIGNVLPTASLSEGTLVRLCYLDIVQAVQRHDGTLKAVRVVYKETVLSSRVRSTSVVPGGQSEVGVM
jgi:hypothetical protein